MLSVELLASLVLVALGFLAFLWISRFVYQLVTGPPGEGDDDALPTRAAAHRSSVINARAPGLADAVKVCPQCAEEVKAAALLCRYCRYEFDQLPPPRQPGT